MPRVPRRGGTVRGEDVPAPAPSSAIGRLVLACEGRGRGKKEDRTHPLFTPFATAVAYRRTPRRENRRRGRCLPCLGTLEYVPRIVVVVSGGYMVDSSLVTARTLMVISCCCSCLFFPFTHLFLDVSFVYTLCLYPSGAARTHRARGRAGWL